MPVAPPPMIPAVDRLLFLPTLITRKSERQWGHRQGQEVSRAERAEREERPARLTSCPQDTRPTLWPGHRPFLPVMRGRRPAKLSVHHRCAWCTALKRYAHRRPPGEQVGYSSTGCTHATTPPPHLRRLRRFLVSPGYSPLFVLSLPSLSYRRCASILKHTAFVDEVTRIGW